MKYKIKGNRNMLLGSEGLFNTVITGPGKVVLRTMPISRAAAVLLSCMHGRSN